jgi:hypothetical protein
MKAKEFIPVSKPRNFVAKNQQTAGAGAHRDKKQEQKKGYEKHKQKQFEQGVAEGLTEARNSLFAFVKQHFPSWPDYVLKDFLYAQAKGIRDQAELDDFLKRNKQDFGNCKWTLTKLPITFDIFTPKTQRMLASREGGSSNPFQVPRDAERHAQQSQMIQQKGVSAEPIIVAKLSNGYDLIEGWHRTIQHLKAFPQGYTGPAWVCTGATYKSESVEQGVAEAVQNMIDEDINQNLVYHSVPNGQIAARIINSGHLRLNEPFDFDRDYGSETRNAMSVSRDQYFRYGDGVVQFVLDKDALKKAGWKVVPKVGVGVGYKSEREERVYHSKDAPVPLKQPLVIAIQYDPKLKLPPAFKQSVASLNIPLVPMRSSKPQADTSTEPKQPKPASKYTDPNALKLNSQDWFGEIAWTISYMHPDGSGSFIHPYYLAKDETMVKKAYAAIKDRIAKGLSFDDLLPQDQFGRTFKSGTYSIKPGEKGYKPEKGVAEDQDDREKIMLVKSLKWPEIVNKVNSAMKAMGWKGQRKDDGSFMFSTRGQLDEEWYIVVIDNRGNNMFTYALGTVEEGDPYIGEQESLPMTEASVSELMDAIREGFSLNEHRVTEASYSRYYYSSDKNGSLEKVQKN